MNRWHCRSTQVLSLIGQNKVQNLIKQNRLKTDLSIVLINSSRYLIDRFDQDFPENQIQLDLYSLSQTTNFLSDSMQMTGLLKLSNF